MWLSPIRGWTSLVLALGTLLGVGCAADPQIEETATTAEPALVADELEVAPAPETPPNADEVVVAPEKWASLKAEIRDRFPEVAQLSVDELKRWLQNEEERPLLLDVREPKEFGVSHLEGARLANNEAVALDALGDAPLNRRVVLYCSVGYRSSALAEKLEERGYTNVFNLEGSIFEWANRGERVVTELEPVKLAHPYDSEWGLLLRRDYWSSLSESK